MSDPNPADDGSAIAAAAPVSTGPNVSSTRKLLFVSYGSSDQEAAFRLCRLLELRGIPCWIAPRDVVPGADYGEAIIHAIEDTEAMALLLSVESNNSIHVRHEVERAVSKGKRVIPVRLEDVLPGPALELHLCTAHWLDAWQLTHEQVAASLALALQSAASPLTQFTPRKPSGRKEQSRKFLWLAVLALLPVIFGLWRGSRTPPASDELRVKSFQVHHFRKTGEDSALDEGVIGESSFSATVGDQVTIDVELSRPAYAYLVAFRPDGVMELISPNTDDQPPGRGVRVRYPTADKLDRRYGLQEGSGLWIFAVAASEKPLPAYKNWSEVKPAAWVPLSGQSVAVLNHDGIWVETLTPGGRMRAKDESALGAVSRFDRVIRYLKGQSGAMMAGGRAFVVQDPR